MNSKPELPKTPEPEIVYETPNGKEYYWFFGKRRWKLHSDDVIENIFVNENNVIKGVSVRNGTCPHCNKGITIPCSIDICYWCRKPILWR